MMHDSRFWDEIRGPEPRQPSRKKLVAAFILAVAAALAVQQTAAARFK